MASPAPSTPLSTIDRRSRFASAFGYDTDDDNDLRQSHSQQQRATSQPPRAQEAPRYDHLQRRLEESVSPPPASSRKLSTSSAASGWPPAIARPNPTGSRSVSFSYSEHPTNSLNTLSAMSTATALMSHLHHHHESSFPSTFEDDEASDGDFDYATPRRQDSNHTRSRPQSIGPAVERRARPINTAANSSFGASYGFTQGGGGGGGVGYGSIGTGNTNGMTPNSAPGSAIDDHTNMSPFMRDVSRILPPDNQHGGYAGGGASSRTAAGMSGAQQYGSAAAYGHRSQNPNQMWGGNGGGVGGGTAANSYSGLGLVGGLGDDHNGGGSGTTSRRHSVSVLQPRRISVGFNVGSGSRLAEEPPSPMSSTSERPSASFGRSGGAMFSDEELAGSLNMLSLNNIDDGEDYRRPLPRVSGPSQPSSLPTYAPHRQHRGSPLDTLRLPQHMVGSVNNIGASSPTSSLGAPGDDFDGIRRRGLGSVSRSSSAARYSDGGDSPERRQSRGLAQADPYGRTYQQNNGIGTIGNGYDPLAGVFGGNGIPSPTASFRAVDALKQPSTYSAQSQFQDMFDNNNNNHNAGSSPQTRGRAASASVVGTGAYDYDATVTNTPSGPISLSPTNSVRLQHPSQYAVGLQRMSPTTAVGQGYANYGTVGIPNGSQYYGQVAPGMRPRQNSLPPSATSPTAFHHQQQMMMHQQQQQQHQQQQQGPAAGGVDVGLGRGVPLYAVPRDAPLYIVEFKAGRNDIFYVADPQNFYATNSPGGTRGGELRVGELVIVEADRGRDLGKVTHGNISTADVEAWQRQQAEMAALAALQQGGQDEPGSAGGTSKPNGVKELMPKKIYARASADDTQQLHQKNADEQKALQLCQSKVRQKKLPMEVVDAEYQWDRRKLTFYFVADRRIDFRELVRELFRLYKTRIWMACLQGPPTTE